MEYNTIIKDFGAGRKQVIFYPYLVKGIKHKSDDDEIIELKLSDELYHHVKSRESSYSRTKKKMYDYVRVEENQWRWFVTLTFNKKRVISRFDYEMASDALMQWLDMIRKRAKRSGYELQYFIVPEMHKGENSERDSLGRYAWHFHGLFGECPFLDFNFWKYDKKSGRAIYNIDSYGLGYTTATRITDRNKAASYIMKYSSKDMCGTVSKGKKRYWTTRNLALPEQDYFMAAKTDIDLVRDTLISMSQCVHFSEKPLKLEYLDTPIDGNITYIELETDEDVEKVLSYLGNAIIIE